MHRIEGAEDTFVLFEEWASQNALDGHDVAPHIVAQDALNEQFRAGPATVLRLGAESIA